MLGEDTAALSSLHRKAALHEQRGRENEAQAIHMAIRQRLFALVFSRQDNPDLVIYAKLPPAGGELKFRFWDGRPSWVLSDAS